ncbi:MAG TPA: hypothetical protein VIX82_16310, partial [Solirubrobacteraceae bacterium]
AATPRLVVDAFEIAGGKVMVGDRHSEPAHRGIQGWAFRHRPGPQHAVELEPKVEVSRGRVVQLDNEP